MELASTSPGLDFEPPPMIHELVARDQAPADYVDALQSYARLSRAVRHPLLDMIAGGSFHARRAALRCFFREYYHYSRRFTRFLASVMAALEEPEHRAALIPNSAEEAGHLDDHHRAELLAAGLDPADVAAPHPVLFRRFLVAIGLSPGDLQAATPHIATAAWIHSFESLCRADEASAVGALGLATEGIVRGMYQKILAGIRRAWPELSSRDRAFFELHALVDDDHAETLRGIAIALAADPDGRRSLAVGVLGALDARASFYDQMQLYLVSTDRGEEERS
jgi:pyrroloquinoline quinone (PQQ) biosynthesis protein C